MFERKSMEQIVEKMIRWARASTTKLTDFRVGSKTRTLFEAVGVVIEELYDRVYRTIKKLIEDNIYTVIGFDKLPATYASGLVEFRRATPAETDILIPAGTLLHSQSTSHRAPNSYRTTMDVYLLTGTTSVEVEAVCETAGVIGNAGANSITVMPLPITGIDTVTNPTAFVNGAEEETKSDQKARFNEFIEANARGILQSIEYGARLANLRNDDGLIMERVTQSKAFEYLPERKGEVDLYIWNGVGQSSEALKAEVRKIQTGYYDEGGNPVYGYKPAGIWLNIYSAPIKYVTLKVEFTSEAWADSDEIQELIEREIDVYFNNLQMGQTVIQTDLEARIKFIEGVYDVKLYVSTDNGQTYNTENIDTESHEIAVVRKPVTYVTK